MHKKPSQFGSALVGAMVLVICLFLPSQSNAKQGGDVGVGLVIGKPAGLSGKVWLGETNALDLTLGFNVLDDWMSLNADYVWHDFSLFQVPQGSLPLYYGMGIWAAIANHGGVGVRGVVGIDYLFAKAPLDAFFEICPGISIIPGTHVGVDAGLGMRYFF
jgi:hypothetical protein